MSNSPIFSQLASEFASEGKTYDSLVRWSTPAFRWSGPDYVVQLDKQPKGISLEKAGMFAAEGFISGLTAGVQPLSAKQLAHWTPANVPQKPVEESSEDTMNFGRLLSDYVAQVGKSFAQAHPLAMVTDTHTEINDDGSATVVFEAVQPITSVMPLSERSSAQPME